MISVITINYNLSTDTIPCIESILASTYNDFIVYLIDNGSKHDDYQRLLDSFGGNPRVQVLRIEKNCGYVGGVNHGLEEAIKVNPNYFLIMNNDTIIDKHAITELVGAAKRHSNRAIVSGKVYYHSHPDTLQHTGVVFKDPRYLTTSYPGQNQKDVGQFDEELERDSLDDVFWLFPSQLIKDIGLYCNYFFLYAEQGDFAQRARRSGYKLIFTPNAKIWHKESMTIGAGNPKALRVHYWRGKSSVIFKYRNLKTKYFIVGLINAILKTIAYLILRRNGKRSFHVARLRGYFAGVLWLFNKKPDTGYNPYV